MIGKILGGRYEIIEQIGGGGMALVYKAKCQLLDRFVAVKVLKEEFVNDEEFVRKFRRESQAAASLSHPNIVNIYDVGVENDEDSQIYYIVMEYIKGKTLKEIIKENGKLSIENTLEYSYRIAEALQHAHKNHLVHRDIKPHNIMITDDNRVKVTDFGIARAATSSTMTTTSNVLGSVHYFSPEQARGGYTDEKSDIYSLGIVMYEMLTGKLPYEGESPITVALKHVQEDIRPPREFNSEIPIGFENIILKCVQKRQADRYANITELIKDLRRIKGNPTDFGFEDMDNYDSHTKIIPIVDIEDDEIMKDNKKSKITKKTSKKDSGGKVIFLGIFLAFLLATSIWLGAYKLKSFFASGDLITVPNIVGMQEEEARKKIEDLGLKFEVESRVKNSEYKAGEVIFQSEAEDTKLKEGYPIKVTISEGDNQIKVPNFVDEDLDKAKELAEKSDLLIRTDYQHSDTVPENVVISQTPDSGSSVEPGTRITLVISQGKEIKLVIMPKVTGLNIEKAKSEILKAGLQVGDVIPQPSENAGKDIVTWQSYNQGTELESDTAVDLYISSGPSQENNNEGENNNTGDKEESITFIITPPPDTEETRIKIIKIQDGRSEVVYDRTHKATEEPFYKTFKGKKSAVFEIYYNDEFKEAVPKKE
ncbi:serine/threonine protein kinase [Tissierella praeacuta DSM 18095]|uniref:non-specific serine/threonine protein kinase n=2 Tax=Tissierella praeacuta TaxID=43131 RepID=A0A1M4SQC4_9FIRM|nr:Stk1 family PASTA domain-containing Ser/Thr kinase [Tissierella praeacuta]TCU70640.1 serine/threonine-protein kinase [Tissierella praeacuta]SHE34410.1 serine/threonine protein kinase [Tissierella praeacuta DSM 18095]SUP01654.1 Serine/threonine-protein kinase PrkC [Tissierella praeacuta]